MTYYGQDFTDEGPSLEELENVRQPGTDMPDRDGQPASDTGMGVLAIALAVGTWWLMKARGVL